MEPLGDILAPYSDVIAKFAGTVTMMQFLSGIFLVNDIRRKGCSDAYPPEPFIGSIVLSVLSLKMGTLMGDSTMIVVNIVGFAISVVFMTTFYWFASNEFKSKIMKKIGIAGAFIIAVLAYSNFEDPEKIEFRFGILITAILVFLVGSPLLNLGDIIARKSIEGMPFPIILAGTIVAASWALYGISIRNPMVVYQNLFLLFLSSIQLSLFAIYPNTPSVDINHSTATLKQKSTKATVISPSKNSIRKKD